MNVSIKQTLTISKKGKRVIIEEDEYEFCEDLWRHIKEFLFHDQKWFHEFIMPHRIVRLYEAINNKYCSPQCEERFQKLQHSIWRHQGGYEQNINSKGIERFGLPRFKKETLETFQEGRRAGYKFAQFHYKLAKGLVDRGEMEEDEAFYHAKRRLGDKMPLYEQLLQIEEKQKKTK